MYNLIEYSDAYLKISGGLRQYYRDEPILGTNENITDFSASCNNSASFKFKQQMEEQTGNSGKKDVEIMVPFKYLSNFRRTLELYLINCEISLQLKWSKKLYSSNWYFSKLKSIFWSNQEQNSIFLL